MGRDGVFDFSGRYPAYCLGVRVFTEVMMNKADFRHNHFNKIQLMIKQRDELNKKIDKAISQMVFVAITQLPDVPEDSILARAGSEE